MSKENNSTTNSGELLKLIRENPNLPVVPMVDYEVCGDDSCIWWLGRWLCCEITEYYLGEERIHFKDDDEEFVLNDLEGCRYGHTDDGRDIYELSDEEWDKLYQSIPWTKAIVVYIGI